MRGRIFLKLVAVFVLIVAAPTLLLEFSMRRVWKESLRGEIEHALVEKTRLFAFSVEHLGAADLQKFAHEQAKNTETDAMVIDRSGKVLVDSQGASGPMGADNPEVRDALGGKTGIVERHNDAADLNYLYVAAPIKNGAVRMAYPLSEIDRGVSAAQRNLFRVSGVSLLAVVLFAAYIARSFSHRLGRIVAFAERISSGDLSARIAPTANDEITEVALALDRTARQVEWSFQQLESSRQELETLLNSMQEAVIAVSKDRRVLWANGPMNRAVPGGVRISAPLVETIRVPEFLQAIQETIDTREVRRARAELPDRNRRFQVTAAPMPGGGAVAVLDEITEIERLEKTRRDFIANVSHELRTPLTSIQGYVETLIELDANADHETTRDFLDIIRKNTSRMTRLTEDLLTLARVESGEDTFHLQDVTADLLLRDVVQSFSEVAKLRNQCLHVENKATSMVRADPDKIHQVLGNLIDNALKYSAPTGKIVVGARDVESGVEFFVQDFGSGIPSEHLPRLFERFYRVDKARSRESGGTGLGLAIAKHIVLKHGGEIHAESKLNSGSIFLFTLPAAEVATPVQQPS